MFEVGVNACTRLARPCTAAMLVALAVAVAPLGCTSGPAASDGSGDADPQVAPETCQGEEVDLDVLDEAPQRRLSNGVTVGLVAGSPNPVDRGDNTFTIELTAEDGSAYAHPGALDGETFLLSPFMPAHGHGTVPLDFAPDVAASDREGTYVFGPIDLFMPGRWDLHFRLLEVGDDDNTTGAEEDAVFTFCIEG